jgi:hypothetical protein
MPSGPLYDYAPDVVADQQPQLLPVADPPQQYDYLSASGRPRVVIQSNPDPMPTQQNVSGGGIDGSVSAAPQLVPVEHDPFATVKKVGNKLFGLNGEERYQLWPEKLIRSGVTAAGDALQGNIPQYQVDPNTGDVHTSSQMIERALDMSSVAGTGGLAGADGTLGSTPFLRPALKYEGKIYKAPMGGQHLDALPPELANTFQKQAMSGEDISNFNFGFMNEKGKFLNREQALEHGINTGLIDPHAGQYGALTSTLLADSSKPGTAIEALAKTNAPSFYSALEHNVNNISQPKMTGEQWLGTLGNKPGVKPEELQWTGLSDFLKENGNKPVTKQQVVDHLQNNKVELKEVQKGGKSPDERKAELEKLGDDRTLQQQNELEDIHEGNWQGEHGVNATKYHSYQLPGGENYREMLMTLNNKTNAEKYYNDKFYSSGKMEKWKNLDADAKQMYQKIADSKNNYQSSHWDEPNILAHVRMNDRTIDGKKSLHLEEIQSDWHQQGRDKGYAPTEAEKTAASNQIKEIRQQQQDLLKSRITKTPDGKYSVKMDNGETVRFNDQQSATQVAMMPTGEVRPKWIELDNKAAELGRIASNMERQVPDAPFKKTWHELALKRMIREAAEKGYDRLSWTPGEAQAARYDLSKSVSEIHYNPNTGYSKILDKNGRDISTGPIPKNKLADTIGKEAAQKLLETKPNNLGIHSLEGKDLKIGGEGMKGFYDSIIPKSVEKMTKEHGVKVKQTIDPNAGEKFAFMNNKEAKAWLKDSGIDPESVTLLQVNRRAREGSKFEPVHYIDIPQSLKDVVMKRGQPLFSAGLPLVQVDHDPFEKKK